jgi:hypothetical protein
MNAMVKTGLGFAPGTTPDCQRLVARMFSPEDIFGAYKAGRQTFKTGDLVLVASERDADGFKVQPRMDYVKDLRRLLGPYAPRVLAPLTIAHKTAHAQVQLPFEADAMWVVIVRGLDQIPTMCVIYATQYEETVAAN